MRNIIKKAITGTCIESVRKDIELLAAPILRELGFKGIGELGEYIRITSDGDHHGVLLDVIQKSNSYVIDIRTFVYYSDVERCFGNEPGFSFYTVNIYQSAKSISIHEYNVAWLLSVLEQMINNISEPFFKQYGFSQAAINNLALPDFKAWFTSDKLAQYKVKMAAAIFSNNRTNQLIIAEEVKKYCRGPSSIPYLVELRKIIESI